MIMASELTTLAQLLLNTIHGAGDWVTRKDIGFAIGRPKGKLSPYDIEILDDLEQRGYIESSQNRTGVVRFEFRYRVKGGNNGLS